MSNSQPNQPSSAELRNRQRASDLVAFAIGRFALGTALVVTGYVHFDEPRITRTIPGFIFLGIGLLALVFSCGVVEEVKKMEQGRGSSEKVTKRSDWLYLFWLVDLISGIPLVAVGFAGPDAPDLGLYVPGFILIGFSFLYFMDAYSRETKEKAAINFAKSNPNHTTLSPVYSVATAPNNDAVPPPPPYVPPPNYGFNV